MSEYDKVRSLIDECLESKEVPSNSEQLSGSVYFGCIVSKFQELNDVISSVKEEMPALLLSVDVFGTNVIRLQKVYYSDRRTNFIFGTKSQDYYKLSVLHGDDDAFCFSTYYSSLPSLSFRDYARTNLPTLLKYTRKIEKFPIYFPNQTVCTAEESKDTFNLSEQFIEKKMRTVFEYDDTGNYQICLGMVSYVDPNDLFNMNWLNRERLFDYARNNVNAILKRTKVYTETIPVYFKPIIEEAFTKCALPELEVPKEKVLTCKRN